MNYDEWKLETPSDTDVVELERCKCCGDFFDEGDMVTLGFAAYSIDPKDLVCPGCFQSLNEEYKN